MKKTLALVFILYIVIGFWIAAYLSPSFRSAVYIAVSRSPCSRPVRYHIGSLDPKFNLSLAQASESAAKAASLWSSAYGQTLFTSSPDAGLVIDFVYDERSALNSQLLKQESQLDKNSASLQKQIDQYKADESRYAQKLADFNLVIQKYNRSGGAPPDIYQQLISQQKTLAAEGAALNQRANQLNLAAKNYNSRLEDFNEEVSQYNQAITLKPEAGVYRSADRNISVYFAADPSELVHTLAHEFGHALGMDHASGSSSLMSYYTNNLLEITPEDHYLLALACRPVPYPTLWYLSLRNFVQQLIFN